MAPNTKVNSDKMKFVVTAGILGLMENNTKVSGPTTRCTVMASSFGKIKKNTLETL